MVDAFNAAAGSGVLLPISSVDITILDVIGYDLRPGSLISGTSPTGGSIASGPSSQLEAVPEPGSLVLLLGALLGLRVIASKRSTLKPEVRQSAVELARQRVL
jgi:PEP-CTERM motif